ncbi:hypothetical protein A1O1_04714 [Capronia coronata CBS 617.96]|uniref:Uncharacterized protein n=1 Tax=Capronia coronata CBS 617.96 TaxID=1182541 RepID=W9Y4N6_9EURO|nr:uncharacterized protein A1O1_04714 [Capronia coronata CBS 617.96]EXJ87787.1 hypothetical protein A1O1_04714 [Capronia coronata CBS 617.96]
MRPAAVFTALLFTASALAVPLNAAPGSKALEPAKRNAAPMVDVATLKRALIDLSPVTHLVGDVLATVTGILSIVTNTVNGLDAAINQLLSEAETDVDGTLGSARSTLQGLISQLNNTLGDVGVSASSQGVSLDLTTTISAVQTLLADVESLGGINGNDLVSEVTALVQELLNTLTGLTGLKN